MNDEPVAIIGSIAAVIVFVLANFDIVVDASVVEALILSAVTVVGAVIARSKVTPVE